MKLRQAIGLTIAVLLAFTWFADSFWSPFDHQFTLPQLNVVFVLAQLFVICTFVARVGDALGKRFIWASVMGLVFFAGAGIARAIIWFQPEPTPDFYWWHPIVGGVMLVSYVSTLAADLLNVCCHGNGQNVGKVTESAAEKETENAAVFKSIAALIIQACLRGELDTDEAFVRRILRPVCDYVEGLARAYNGHVRISLSEKKETVAAKGLHHTFVLIRSGLPWAFVGPGWVMPLDVGSDVPDSFLVTLPRDMAERYGPASEEEKSTILSLVEPATIRSSIQAFVVV